MSAQVVTTTAVSSDSYKKGAAAIDISIGRKMAFAVIPDGDAGGTAVATSYLFEAIQADDAALTSNVEALGSVSVVGTEVLDGKVIEVPIAKATDKQYLGVRVTPTGGTSPSVTLNAYLVPADEIPQNPYFSKVVDTDV